MTWLWFCSSCSSSQSLSTSRNEVFAFCWIWRRRGGAVHEFCVAIGDPKVADLGVAFGRDGWESFTIGGSGVSIVKDVATRQLSDNPKDRRLGVAGRMNVKVVFWPHHKVGVSQWCACWAFRARRFGRGVEAQEEKTCSQGADLGLKSSTARKGNMQSCLPFLLAACRRVYLSRREGRCAGATTLVRGVSGQTCTFQDHRTRLLVGTYAGNKNISCLLDGVDLQAGGRCSLHIG